MEKQTAVEWLIQKLTNRENGFFDGFPHLSIDKIYEQAKQMEKEQIMDAYWDGGQDIAWTSKICEQYYNKTYTNEK
jgi:hypothetical protein